MSEISVPFGFKTYLQKTLEDIQKQLDFSYKIKLTSAGTPIPGGIRDLDENAACGTIGTIKGIFVGLETLMDGIIVKNNKDKPRSLFAEWAPSQEVEIIEENIKIDLVKMLRSISLKAQSSADFAFGDDGNYIPKRSHGVLQKLTGFRSSIEAFVESMIC